MLKKEEKKPTILEMLGEKAKSVYAIVILATVVGTFIITMGFGSYVKLSILPDFKQDLKTENDLLYFDRAQGLVILEKLESMDRRIESMGEKMESADKGQERIEDLLEKLLDK